MTSLLSLFLLSTLVLTAPNLETVNIVPAESAVTTHNTFSKVDQQVRNAAVRVSIPTVPGYGSGTYFKYQGHLFVITAAHVAEESSIATIISPRGEKVEGSVVYSDRGSDYAVIIVPKLQTRQPIKFKASRKLVTPGDGVTYTGYPAWHYSPQTFHGVVSGYENRSGLSMMVNSYFWFGTSGSCLFNSKGEVVGIMSAIKIVSWRGEQQTAESFGVVRPITLLDQAALKAALALEEST